MNKFIEDRVKHFERVMQDRVNHISIDPDDPRIGWQSKEVLKGFFRKALEDQQKEFEKILSEQLPILKTQNNREFELTNNAMKMYRDQIRKKLKRA